MLCAFYESRKRTPRSAENRITARLPRRPMEVFENFFKGIFPLTPILSIYTIREINHFLLRFYIARPRLFVDHPAVLLLFFLRISYIILFKFRGLL